MDPQNLLSRAQEKGTPIIDGTQVTFLWEGEWAPQLIGEFTHWENDALSLEYLEQGLWAVAVDLPADAYLEYAFWANGERILDPCNRHRASTGFGTYNNYFYTPNAGPSPLLKRRKGVGRGEVFSQKIDLGWFYGGGQRRVHFYRPPVDEPAALMVVWDGQDYLRRAALPIIVDNLLAQGRIPPLALAMVENGGRRRGLEYLCSEATLLFLQKFLLPAAYDQLNLIDVDAAPGAFGVLGASAGGLMAMYTGLRLPHIFGHVLAQSGAYSLEGIDFPVWDLARHLDPAALKIWMDAGSYEMLADSNRGMAALLNERGFEGEYHEYQGGHNYPAWRNDVGRGLEYLFGAV